VYKPADKIKGNETIVLINKKNVETLAEMVLGVVDEHPSMKRIITLVRSWVHVLQRGMKVSEDTPDDLLRKLQENGSKIKTEMTINWWAKTLRIGPRDKQDIKRIGDIYRDEFLSANYIAVNVAITRLRGIHVSLGRKLCRMIPQAGVVAQKKSGEEGLIDRDLNLYIEDFIDMVSFHKVIEVKKDVEVDYFKLNRLIK